MGEEESIEFRLGKMGGTKKNFLDEMKHND